ncbi:porin family protein [Bradyrhizobium manausense]|uniref:outer membrane protein n=1 Tax=Bradyrhizobium manausense TaxID=989370 RepID=UPI001BA7B720|nr:outer membrane beta-barrel protein [Bradyrhizobium manausense]MBR1086652.1 porin family protein [Bradyrhizobium manausense]
MSKHFWGSLLVAALLGGPAVAADMPMPVKALPLPVAVYTWTGCYIGGSGGGLWAHKRWTDADNLSTTLGSVRFNHTAGGGMVGGQLGCDYQVGRWVFGIEGSYHWADSNATSNDLIFTNVSGTTNVSGFGTVTGRVGYTIVDQALIYVRGGVAFERDRYSTNNLTTGVQLTSASENRTGGLVGVGFEYLFLKNLSAFVEYDYADMGSRDVNFSFLTRPGSTTYSIRERKDIVKVGINYHFNLAQPVVAKY